MPKDRDLTDSEAMELLVWYRAQGVDAAVSETPVDHFALAQAAKSPPAAQTRARTSAANGAPLGTAQNNGAPLAGAPLAGGLPEAPEAGEDRAEAAKIAARAADMDALRAAMDAFEGSGLKKRATQLVFGDGNPQAEIMLIGEAPGREEDLQGKPFVGRSGQLLDRMLAAIGLDRTKVYIANTVPWRPPGNRTPSPAEISTCLPFLYRQIALVDPKIVVSLGAPATQTLLGRPVSITKVRGAWSEVEVNGKRLPLLPMLHPAYLLRQPAQKTLAWRDMLSLKKAI